MEVRQVKYDYDLLIYINKTGKRYFIPKFNKESACGIEKIIINW